MERRGLVANRCQARKASLIGRVAGGQPGVGGHDPREAVGVLGDQPQPDQPAPVLADQRDPGQVEGVEDQRAHPADVPRVGVVAAGRGLVRAAEADQVGRDDPQPGVDEHRDHRAGRGTTTTARRAAAARPRRRRGRPRRRPCAAARRPRRGPPRSGAPRGSRAGRRSVVGCAQDLHAAEPRRWTRHPDPGVGPRADPRRSRHAGREQDAPVSIATREWQLAARPRGEPVPSPTSSWSRPSWPTRAEARCWCATWSCRSIPTCAAGWTTCRPTRRPGSSARPLTGGAVGRGGRLRGAGAAGRQPGAAPRTAGATYALLPARQANGSSRWRDCRRLPTWACSACPA